MVVALDHSYGYLIEERLKTHWEQRVDDDHTYRTVLDNYILRNPSYDS